MPKLISSLIALVIGYLDGAGLGAATYDLLAGSRPGMELKIALIAVLVTGPLGALLGVLFALDRSAGAAGTPVK
ncbi:hypothetical protein [Methylocystis parvus]|uniref:Major facilitator superfamily (MFS) profile domain-containing protein n=1 Tax=Methylocystis parvus TaxID=134 RepID=A0A6B8MCG9_9HYPH|nr:hypothetical protein [Methylocystis parvus]QGM99013.1 hypothetical protein F7D14_17005 [Methylocystis parvus]WBK00622.1 hypothetical protein MMG94_02530 [Methylocystis parvus OBBP]